MNATGWFGVGVAVLVLAATPAAAQCPGDCDGSTGVSLSEVMTCAAIHLDRIGLDACPIADANGDGRVRIGEVLLCARSFVFGCPGDPVTPTPTPSVAPTHTAVPTATPVPATATPVPPTATASATPTSVPSTPTATATATPTESSAATCGNGLLEMGESCESCPADCEVAACTAVGPTAAFQVHFSAGTDVTAVTIDLNYRGSVASLPGTRNDASVRERITGLPAGGQSIINDRDYSVRIVKSRTEALPQGLFFTATFDRCVGAPTPTLADFACVVDSCADEFSLPVGDCACTVVLP